MNGPIRIMRTDQSRAGPYPSNKVQAPGAPNSDRSRCRSAGPDDQEALPCRDQTRKRIVLVHPLPAPSANRLASGGIGTMAFIEDFPVVKNGEAALEARLICDIIVWRKRKTVISGKKRGPPPTGKGEPIMVRVQPDLLEKLEAWRAHQEDRPSRPEAIRRLVEQALEKKKR